MTSRPAISIYFPSPINYLADRFTMPIGGAETAVLRISEALARRGIRAEIIDSEQKSFSGNEVLVVKRFPEAVVKLRPQFSKIYFWSPDDIAHGSLAPLRNPKKLAAFNEAVDGVIAISQFQRQRLISIGVEETKVIPSRYGVPSRMFAKRDALPEKICIYTSSPKRGLTQIPQIWRRVQCLLPESQLWVYSSMSTYRKDESEFHDLYRELQQMRNVTYFGAVPWSQLKCALQKARVFLYPNTLNETSSIATLEAIAAGCVVVATEKGALPESAMDNIMIRVRADTESFLSAFASWAVRLLMDDSLFRMMSLRNQLNSRLRDWDVIAEEWEYILKLERRSVS